MLSVLLSQVDIFAGIPADRSEWVAELGQLRGFGKGCAITRQGDPNGSLHVILHGFVRIESAHRHLTRPLVRGELSPGAVVGDMGLLDGRPRLASATAIQYTITLELGVAALIQIVMLYPQVEAPLWRTLSRSLQGTDDLIELLCPKGRG
jgi:CRP/FNR family cyclic AMP-dependent transcriptional regulator